MTIFPSRVHKQLGHLLGCIPFATQMCAVPAGKRLPATMLIQGAGRKQGGGMIVTTQRGTTQT